MILLGIDPGQRSGWVRYNTDSRRVVASGQFDEDDFIREDAGDHDIIVIERPRGLGFNTRPQMVECGIIFGRLAERLEGAGLDVESLDRLAVCKALSAAVHGVINVRNDVTAWAALKLLHGEGCDKKGGPLHGVKAHERAALAVAVAWELKRVEAEQTTAGAKP